MGERERDGAVQRRSTPEVVVAERCGIARAARATVEIVQTKRGDAAAIFLLFVVVILFGYCHVLL